MSEGLKALRLAKRRLLLETQAEKVPKLEIDLRERFIFIIRRAYIERGLYQHLERRYGISARKWKNVCNRVQLPGIDMMMLILSDYPYYSTWLMTGNTYNKSEQIDPTIENGIDQTEVGKIDPSTKGWEGKLEKALWLIGIKSSGNPEKFAAIFPEPILTKHAD